MSRGAVLVTGASSGIGESCAAHLETLGFEVYRGVRTPTGAEREVVLDVTDAAAVAALRERFAGRPLAGLVNNAGIAIAAPLEFIEIERLRTQLEVNVVGLIAVTQALVEPLRLARGRIVNIGSIGGRMASPYFGPYNASKFAVEALTDSLRQELAPWGIGVTVIEPGAIRTPIWGKGREGAQGTFDALGERGNALYGAALARVAALTERLEARGLEPQAVADVVGAALTEPRLRARYVVGREARLQLAVTSVLPVPVRDRLVARGMGL